MCRAFLSINKTGFWTSFKIPVYTGLETGILFFIQNSLDYFSKIVVAEEIGQGNWPRKSNNFGAKLAEEMI